jgi:predicted aspartyl protease
MGELKVPITVQNWLDVEKVALGERSEPPPKAMVEALVDTGAGRLYLKSSVINQLGLRRVRDITSRTMADLSVARRVFSNVDLEIQGRSTSVEVVEVPDTLPNVVGQVPLGLLDFVVDLRNRRLIPNPEHQQGELCDDF